jgi:hypothetical protein
MQASMSEWFVRAVALCYQRPGHAVMQSFAELRGQAALLRKLSMRPDFFGKQLFASGAAPQDFESSRLRREAKQAAALLPLLAMEVLPDRRRSRPRKLGRRA